MRRTTRLLAVSLLLAARASWAIETELDAPDAGAAKFGAAVALSSTVAVVGAPSESLSYPQQGAAYVFTHVDGGWSPGQQLSPPNPVASEAFGSSVAVSGNLLLVGAPDQTVGANNAQGAVYVFGQLPGGAWQQQGQLTADGGAAGDYFGNSVALWGGRALVGANGSSVLGSPGAGAAYVFDLMDGGVWRQTARLTAWDFASNDGYGYSVSVWGNAALVGSPNHAMHGVAYLYGLDAGAWLLTRELVAPDTTVNDAFGASVSLSANVAAVGAHEKSLLLSDGGSLGGVAYVFAASSASLPPVELVAEDEGPSDFFGYSVSLSNDDVVVGAPQKSLGLQASRGAAYVFSADAGWAQTLELLANDGAPGDQFGLAVSGFSGAGALIGAPYKLPPTTTSQGVAYVETKADAAVMATDAGAPDAGAADAGAGDGGVPSDGGAHFSPAADLGCGCGGERGGLITAASLLVLALAHRQRSAGLRMYSRKK